MAALPPHTSPTPHARAEQRRAGWRLPLAAALLCAGVRTLVVLSRLDEQELELYSGTLAQALLAGMPLEPAQLPVIPHNRGSVVFGFVLAPLFALLGPTLATIKLLALTLSAATAALFTHLLERHVGRTAAASGALLYAFLPPSFQVVDVLALGSHGDSLLWTLAALALILAWGGPALGTARALLLGALIGFAGFFSFQSIVAVPALLAAWFARDPRFWARRSTYLVAAVALLWIPAAGVLVPAGEGAIIVGQSATDRFLPAGLWGASRKLVGTLLVQLRASWMFEQHGGAWASWLLFASLVAGGLFALRSVVARRALLPFAAFAFVYPALIVGAYAASNFQMKLDENLDGMGSRYLMPALPFLAAWVALGAEGLTRRGRSGLARVLIGAPLVAGIAGVAGLVDFGQVGREPTVRGSELTVFHSHVAYAGGDDLVERLAWLEKVEPDWPDLRALAYRSFARSDWAARDLDGLLAVVAEERATPDPVREYVLVELGRTLAERDAQPRALILAADAWDEFERRAVWQGFGAASMGRVIALVARRSVEDPTGAAPFAAALRRLSALEAPDRAHALAGMGFQLGTRLTTYQPTGRRTVRGAQLALSGAELETYFEFVGRGYRLRYREQGYSAPAGLRIEAILSDPAKAAFRRGLQAGG